MDQLKTISPPKDFDELTRRLRQDFSTMTNQFQVGAKYLLDFPAEVPIASMRKIARQAKVQPATLVRLAQSLGFDGRSEEHTSELQSLMRISYAVFCLKKKQNRTNYN